jgi:hypothetical protein
VTLPTADTSGAGATSDQKPLGATAGPPGVPRYRSMAALVSPEPIAAEQLAAVLAQHRAFLDAGGGGGRWETLVTTADYEIGVVFGVYVGPKPAAGAQARLAHQRLEGVDLRGLNLPYADLCGCVARGQDLSDANLSGSLIIDGDFSHSSFRAANLAHADLSRTDLRDCDFGGADLTGADLEKADLTGADLRGARLDGARWPGAVLDSVRW